MAEFSRMCNVSRKTITKHAANGNIILTPDRMVDLDNVANKSFLRAHLTAGTATRDAPKTATPAKQKSPDKNTGRQTIKTDGKAT